MLLERNFPIRSICCMPWLRYSRMQYHYMVPSFQSSLWTQRLLPQMWWQETLLCRELAYYRWQRNETLYQECMPWLDYPHRAHYNGTDTHSVYSLQISRVLVADRLSTKWSIHRSVFGTCQNMSHSVILCLHTLRYTCIGPGFLELSAKDKWY